MEYKGRFGKWHSSEKQAGIKNLFRYLYSYQGGCIEFMAWTKEPYSGSFIQWDTKAKKSQPVQFTFSKLEGVERSKSILDGMPANNEFIAVQSAFSMLCKLAKRESIYARPGTRGTFGTGCIFDFSNIKKLSIYKPDKEAHFLRKIWNET